VIKSKLGHINKVSDKPKRSAFKRPTLHTQTVTSHSVKKFSDATSNADFFTHFSIF